MRTALGEGDGVVGVLGRVVCNGDVAGGCGVLGSHSQLAAPEPGRHVVFHATYQPASYFWTLQIRETLLFTAIAAMLIVFAAWWTQRRTV